MNNLKRIVVTRHPGLVEWLLQEQVMTSRDTVIDHVDNPDQIRGCHVIGILPPQLAQHAHLITVVNLRIPQKIRGVELNAEQVRECLPDGESPLFSYAILPLHKLKRIERQADMDAGRAGAGHQMLGWSPTTDDKLRVDDGSDDAPKEPAQIDRQA